MEEKQEQPHTAGTVIAMLCCAAGTAALLISFSRPDFHAQTDESFRRLIDWSVKLWNTMPWGFVILGCALSLPLLGLLALPAWGRLTRKAPGGSFLYDRARPCFERTAGIRFLPSFLVVFYFIIAAFMQGADQSMSFDPPGYIPLSGDYSAGEILNVIFMALTVFSVLLIVADGVISAGPWGMLLHIPVILAGNVFLALLMTGIMFVSVTLLGFFGKILMMLIAGSIFVAGIKFSYIAQGKYIVK